jgi:hypothetical protein
VKEKKREKTARTPTSTAVSHWLEELQLPWFVKDGDKAWNASTVPVGRSCARLDALAITLSVVVPERSAIGMVGGSSLGVGGAVALVCEEGIWIRMAGGEDAIVILAS